ncbi:MAG: GreA/GreB family elongation factor, partial [Spirochaetia bacterium]|nr:GreA/GreB family elongation factor [Spirochaetia bacterium]
DHKDLAFFERIERILVGNREKTRAAAFLQSLVEPYRTEENWNAVITLLKKILEYEPLSTKARTDLVKAYRSKYETHSLLADFLKLSDITNNKKPVGSCVAAFERNIVFDKGNYVYHRTRGVGKIAEIDQDQMVIDFRDNPGQKMSIQMAISSLQPLFQEHLWVRYYENPSEVHEMFREDIPLFFEVLVKSFHSRMILSEIKNEVCGRFLPAEDWSRWWSKAREALKGDPRFGFNPKKKDELVLRDSPMSRSEELTVKFQSTTEWDKKLEVAHEILKDPNADDALDVCTQFYREQEENKDLMKRIHAFLFLEAAATQQGDEETPRRLKKVDIISLIKAEKPAALVKLSADTPVVDFKRDIANMIARNREDAPAILTEILYEVPAKINKHVVTEMNRLGMTDALAAFVKRTFNKYREHPETFLWVAKSILHDAWSYDWQPAKQEVMLLVFRLLKPLVQIEKKGTRLKNQAIETLFGTTNINQETIHKSAISEVIKQIDAASLRKMAALFREVPYIPDAHKDNFVALLNEVHPAFNAAEKEDDADEIAETASLFPPDNVILVSAEALEKRKAHLDNLINVELSANSNEIGEAQKLGDLRENAEYKAAMERQTQLQAEITRVSDEVKRAKIIDAAGIRTDIVSIGTRVRVKTPEGESRAYSILGPWDADSEKNIISYLSPLGKMLIGKRPGETGSFESSKKYTVESIAKAL